MSDQNTVEALAGEISERVKAQITEAEERVREGVATKDEVEQLRSQLEPQALESKVKETLGALLESDEGAEIVRKVKFAGNGGDDLAGTKYARRGLSAGDVEFMHDLLDSARENGIKNSDGGTVSGPSEELRNTVTDITQGRRVAVSQLRAEDEARLGEMLRDGQLSPKGYERAVQSIQAAHDTAESGFGQELVGQQYISELWAGARRSSRVFGLIENFPMTDPTAFLPVEADIPEPIFVAENTDNNSSDYGTQKSGSNRVQVDAKKILWHQMWSGEMEEDSIIPFIPFIRRQQGVALAHYSDSLVLNGDTTNAATGNINLDDADPADTKYYLAFDGIRHAALVDNTDNDVNVAGAITLNQLRKVKSLLLDSTYLHDWGHPVDPDDLIFVADPETADAIAFLDEVLTVDKYGPRATVLTGEQARVLSHPLIASIAMSKTEADGKVSTTGSNNVKGQVAAFNRRGCAVGTRRTLRVETERLPARDQTRIVLSTRMGFGRFTPTGAASGVEWASTLRNIDL